MKDLLVYVPPVTQHPWTIEYATSFASTMHAHLDGLIFTIIPVLAANYASLPDTFYQTLRKNSEVEAANAERRFIEYAERAGIQHTVRNFESFAGDADDTFARAAQTYDLAIVPQSEGTAFFNPRFDNIMLMSGRPTLFVPSIHRGSASLERVLLCWNGDRCAARAAGDGLPLMKYAKTVDVLQIEPADAGTPKGQTAEIEIVRHLHRHGVKATQHVFALDNPDVGAAILSFAADCGSNLIIMGGYGHSRAREMLFGGVTRELLASMTVPVLMSH